MIAAPNHELSTALGAAIERETGLIDVDPLVTPARQPGFDLQANFAMKLAKQLGEPPRGLAERVVGTLGDAGGALAAVEVSGPGFVNLAFSSDALAAWATEALTDPRLGVAPATIPQIVTVDYSAPNVAKEMHVGHLRSTVIGDALVRMLEFAGHKVIRMNHLGDWGTQFGMLTQHMLDTGTSHLKDFEALGQLYRAAKERFDSDPAFADSARQRVVALQSGDPETIALWQDLVDVSLAHINALYGQLDVTLTDEHVTGESFYNAMLPGVVEDLLAAGVAVESDGAVVVVSERFTNADGSPAVLIIRKRDGGFGYGTTDLASIRYRVADLHADRLIYITDARQSQHFQQVFDAAARAGWVDARPRRAHLVRHDARRGRQAVQDPLGRHDPALGPARRRDRARAPRRRRQEPGPARGRAGGDRARGRDRRGQVRRPLDDAPARPAVQLRPHARADRQLRPVPAVRVHARGLDRGQGGRGRRAP